MNRDQRAQLLAERSTLREMLDKTPQEDVLERGSLEARLRGVEGRLETMSAEQRPPARAKLTFRGRPVVGGYGIFAEFGATAMKAFVDAVAMLAADMAGPLAGVGRIPNRERNQLLITNTVVGSFGFELEEYREQTLLLNDDAVAQALAQTQALLAGTAGSDDELTEAAAGADPRVINAVRGFLEIMANNEAVCALDYCGHRFAFRDVAEVRRGVERLAQENVHEDVQHLTGEFQGVLPKRRVFEFKLIGEDRVIVGKVGSEIPDPDVLNRRLHQSTTIALVATRLGGGRPKYVLKTEPRWDPVAGELAK